MSGTIFVNRFEALLCVTIWIRHCPKLFSTIRALKILVDTVRNDTDPPQV